MTLKSTVLITTVGTQGPASVNSQEEGLTGEGEEVGDGRAEGSSAMRDTGPAAASGMPDADGPRIRIFKRSQLEGSFVGDFLSNGVNPISGAQISWPHLKLVTSQSPHLPNPSHWGLGLQYMGLGRTRV